MRFKVPVQSDCVPLNSLVVEMLDSGQAIHCMRDPTRGGLATTLNEIAVQSQVSIRIYEDKIPVRDSVSAACEMLGLDPLYVANEGKLVTIVDPECANDILDTMRHNPYAEDSAVIGEVEDGHLGRLVMRTRLWALSIIYR